MGNPVRQAAAALVVAAAFSVVVQATEGPAEVVTAAASRGDMPPLPDGLWAGDEKVRSLLAPNHNTSSAARYESMSGGQITLRPSPHQNPERLLLQAPSILGDAGRRDFVLGQALFNKLWTSSPASTLASDGVGPLYNARACASCHVNNGRSPVVSAAGAVATGLALRMHNDEHSVGAPVYGGQLQTVAVPGFLAEGAPKISTTQKRVRFADGYEVVLQQPHFSVGSLAYGDLDDATRLSPRVAPSLAGLGLLEAIDDAAILVREDPDDRDGDGISGRAVRTVGDDGNPAIGRFGHKATHPTLVLQNADALSTDMGLSTHLFPDSLGDCTAEQTICAKLPDGSQTSLGSHEITTDMLHLITQLTRYLGVPQRRNVDDADVLAGKTLFTEAGCVDCHVPRHVTSREASDDLLAYQLIWPYTDLLVHDMGEELSNGIASSHDGVAPDAAVSSREWRTAPLWGIGLTGHSTGRQGLLHDGRARTAMEAILWHGGEGRASRDRVLQFDARERAELQSFLASL